MNNSQNCNINNIKDTSYHLDFLMNNNNNIDFNQKKEENSSDNDFNNNINNIYGNNVDSADYEEMIDRANGEEKKRIKKMDKIVKGRAKLNENNKNKNEISINIKEKNKLLENIFSEKNSEININNNNNDEEEENNISNGNNEIKDNYD